MKDWRKIAEKNGIKPNTFKARVRNYGWTPERAATQSVKKRRMDNKWRKLANKNGIPNYVYYNRVDEMFWSPEEAATTPVMSRKEASKIANKVKAEYKEIQDKRDFNDENNLFNLTPQHLEMAEQNGIKEITAISRVKRDGWTVQEAVTVPIKGFKRPKGYLKYLEIAKQNGIQTGTYGGRVKRGWSLKNAATITPDLANGSKGPDYEWKKIAEENGIKRGTYVSRIKNGWTKEQASTIPALKNGEYLNEQTKKRAERGYKKFRKG